jgi:hypothetical protein
MTYNISHTRILHTLKVKLYYNLSFEFNYRVLSERENKNIFWQKRTLHGIEWHLALEMPASRMTHAERERESTPVKQYQGKS